MMDQSITSVHARPWYAHYDPGVPHALEYPKKRLDELVSDAARRHPEQVALVYGGMLGNWLVDRTITYTALDALVDRFASGLLDLGVRPGDRVALIMPNCPQFIISACAVWRVGAIVVCCNPLYVERELEHLLNDAGCGVAIAMKQVLPRLAHIWNRTGLQHLVVAPVEAYLPPLLRALYALSEGRKADAATSTAPLPGLKQFGELLKPMQGDTRPQAKTDDDLAVLIYTGGTTGAPKGVCLTHQNLIALATMLNVWVAAQEAGERILAAMPFFHAYGLSVGMICALLRAHTIILIPDPRRIRHVLRSIERHRATFYPGVPSMFIAFNNFPDHHRYDLSSLRAAPCAAAPLPAEVQTQFEQMTGGKIIEAYGLTEAVSAVTADPLGAPQANSIGVPLPDTDVRIVDLLSGQHELPIGERGEIIVRGPQAMKGYWNNPQATADALRIGPDGQSGWLFTGDIGFMSEDGYFHIADRKKDMIIAGGYNIYPANVEAILYEHPAVMEAAVIGVPDPKRGETVKAYVVLKPGTIVAAEEIIQFCRERMAAYKIPRQVVFCESLPKSPLGKVLRQELRKAHAASELTSPP